jgi:hypothetical protein
MREGRMSKPPSIKSNSGLGRVSTPEKRPAMTTFLDLTENICPTDSAKIWHFDVAEHVLSVVSGVLQPNESHPYQTNYRKSFDTSSEGEDFG